MTQQVRFAVLYLLLISGVGAMGYLFPRTEFYPLLLLYAVTFGLYLWVTLKEQQLFSWKWWVFIAFIPRLLLLFSTPELSDDYYRFLWDGLLTNQGINPYEFLPSTLVADGASVSSELYDVLNSQNYYTVYPPINQAVFALSTYLGDGDIYWSAVWLRIYITTAEFFTLIFLSKLLLLWKKDARNMLWYGLNPLVILEFTGNLHSEGFMLCGLVTGLYFARKGKIFISGLFLGAAVLFKVIPVITIPFIWRRLTWKEIFINAGAMVTLWIPFFVLFWHPLMFDHMRQSMQLYFASFEFNSSIYQWTYVQDYNLTAWISKTIKLLMMSCMAYFWWVYRSKKWKLLPGDIMVMYALYLFFGSTIHPWYTLVLVAFTGFTSTRFAVVWSGLIFLTYGTYISSAYQQPLALVLTEYVVVLGWLVWEIKSGKLERA